MISKPNFPRLNKQDNQTADSGSTGGEDKSAAPPPIDANQLQQRELPEHEKASPWKGIIRSLRFFKDFSTEQFDELFLQSKLIRYEKKEYIVRETEPGAAFYILLKGSAIIYKMDVFRSKKELGKLLAGDCFGEISFLLNKARTASILPTEECVVFQISGEDIQKLSKETQIKILHAFCVMLALRLDEVSSRNV
jgi:CRP-like cAMP-binding protein